MTTDAGMVNLSQEERLALQGKWQGLATGGIAEWMGVSREEVRAYLASARDRLGVESTLQALAKAIEAGLIDTSQRTVSPDESFDQDRADGPDPRKARTVAEVLDEIDCELDRLRDDP
jgi:DNA-binding CsgD family transcriptional regulator